MMHLTIGIDIGTSSVRVAAFPTGSWDFLDETLASRSMPVSRDTDGGETVDPFDLLTAVIGAMDDCLANVPTGSCIDAKSGCKVKLYRLTPKPDNLVQTRDRTVSSELFKGVNWSASMQRPGCQDHLQVPSLRGNRRIPHRVFIGVAE